MDRQWNVGAHGAHLSAQERWTSGQLEGAAATRQVYQIAHRWLAVQTSDEWSARVIGSFLSGFHLMPRLDDGPDRVDGVIEAHTGAPPSMPHGAASFAVARGRCAMAGQSYHLEIDESRIIIAPPPSRQISVWFGRTTHARHPVALINTMTYVLQAALRRCALYDLHAACVIEPVSGAGMLLAGTSNSGKSSLTIRLARAGWPYLTDDMSVLNETPDGIMAHGLRRLFAVDESSLAGGEWPRLDEARGTPVNSDPRKRRLDPTILFPNAFAASCLPKALCFLQITGEQVSRIIDLAPTAAMSRLIKLCPWATYDTLAARGHLRVLGLLINQTRTGLLCGGRDLLDDQTQASRLLAAYVNG